MLENRKAEIERAMSEVPEPAPRSPPPPQPRRGLSPEGGDLAKARNEESRRMEAAEAIRDSIAEIRLVPRNARLGIELYGELAALVALKQ